jgi:glycosyltransferase involved in cell wall biosynthesis
MTVDKRSLDIPRVSVLMTVYNGAQFLRESIDSILAQTFPDWEMIAVDDGSSDASPSILANYADPRVRVFQLPKNIGRTPALRHAFDQVRGEYIAVLDQDDVSHPERLERQVAFLDNHPDVVLVGSWAQYIDEAGNVFARFVPPTNGGELHDYLGWGNPIVHSSAMYRQKAALVAGGYPKQFSFAQDYALILALVQNGRLAIINDYLCKLRAVKESMTRSIRHRLIVSSDHLALYQYAAKTLPLSARASRLNRRAIAISEIKCGLATMRDKPLLSGLKMIMCGVVRDPTALWMNAKVRKGEVDPFVKTII